MIELQIPDVVYLSPEGRAAAGRRGPSRAIAGSYREAMTLAELQNRLLAAVQQKVGRGDWSERRLAHLTGYTQPHIHNVLKRTRGLNLRLADSLLRLLGLTIEELVNGCGAQTSASGPLAVCSAPFGLRRPFPEAEEQAASPLLAPALSAGLIDPVVMRLAPGEDSMYPLLLPGDYLLVDRAAPLRTRPDFQHVYVLRLRGRGVACRCQVTGSALVLVSDNRSSAHLPAQVPLGHGDILDIVRGKVVWAGRQLSELAPML